jgi:hypothetical protein
MYNKVNHSDKVACHNQPNSSFSRLIRAVAHNTALRTVPSESGTLPHTVQLMVQLAPVLHRTVYSSTAVYTAISLHGWQGLPAPTHENVSAIEKHN